MLRKPAGRGKWDESVDDLDQVEASLGEGLSA
jgi:hypothetical protein